MKEFFKFMFASMLGFFLTLVILFFIFTAIFMAVISFAASEDITVDANSILHLRLTEEIHDRTPSSPFTIDFNGNIKPTPPGLNDIIHNLEKARGDNRIKGIFLDLTFLPSGMATIEEIRHLLNDFKESGKFIIAYGEGMSQKAYYLATVADEIYLHPEGLLDFRGLSAEVTFIKGLLEKLDVEAQVIRHGKFKSAVEPLIRDQMSDENREQYNKLINSVWEHMIGQISSSRDISVTELNQIADDLIGLDAQRAFETGLVDSLLYKDELLSILAGKTGIDEVKKKHLVSLGDYNKVADPEPRSGSRNKVAVIFATGDIMGGEGSEMSIGSKLISREIRKARLSENVKSVVFRVNSPGGDALASDVIWREVLLTSQVKPVVVSMGNLAASGGYYVSCAADKIIAHPSTITGSIGVFGVIPNFEKMFKNKLGITFDDVQTNENSKFMSVTKPLTPYQREVFTRFIDDIYETFVNHVAEARNMTYEEVDEIAQGRVWSGSDAKMLGLVDEFGGLQYAIKTSADLAGIEDYRIVEYPVQKDPILQLMEDMFGSKASELLEKHLGNNYRVFKRMQGMHELKGVQARLPVELEMQ